MRLKVCLGLILLGLGACANLSGYVRLDLGGLGTEPAATPAPAPPPADAPKR